MIIKETDGAVFASTGFDGHSSVNRDFGELESLGHVATDGHEHVDGKQLNPKDKKNKTDRKKDKQKDSVKIRVKLKSEKNPKDSHDEE